MRGDQRPFGTFPKIHRFWYCSASLTLLEITPRSSVTPPMSASFFTWPVNVMSGVSILEISEHPVHLLLWPIIFCCWSVYHQPSWWPPLPALPRERHRGWSASPSSLAVSHSSPRSACSPSPEPGHERFFRFFIESSIAHTQSPPLPLKIPTSLPPSSPAFSTLPPGDHHAREDDKGGKDDDDSLGWLGMLS